eukprot:2524887-Pleurochrysis_carterae.AAC.1
MTEVLRELSRGDAGSLAQAVLMKVRCLKDFARISVGLEALVATACYSRSLSWRNAESYSHHGLHNPFSSVRDRQSALLYDVGKTGAGH